MSDDVHHNLCKEILDLAELAYEAGESPLSMLVLKLIEVYDRKIEVETLAHVTLLCLKEGQGSGHADDGLSARACALINKVQARRL